MQHNLEQVTRRVEVPGSMSVKKMIETHPMLFGAIISLPLVIAIVVIAIWFPWIGNYHDKHKRLVQACLFTAIYFAAYFFGLRRWRRKRVFWLTILTLFLLHVLGIFLYSTHLQPILVWQWPIIGLLEYYGAAFFLDWSTRRFGHLHGDGRPHR